MSETDHENKNVEVFHRINHLKRKAGGDPNDNKRGSIPEEAIQNADKQIKLFCNDCKIFVGEAMDALMVAWEKLNNNSDPKKRKDHAAEIFTKAHQIKDIAGTCEYMLISNFGESLRDYILETKLESTEQKKIIQAHIDVMNLAYKNDVKDNGGPVAEELRATLKKAIEQHN